MSGWTKFLHGCDRLFNHKRWVKDEKLKTQQKAVEHAHDENIRGIDANKEMNIEGSKNGVRFLSNGWHQNQNGSKAQDMLYDA